MTGFWLTLLFELIAPFWLQSMNSNLAMKLNSHSIAKIPRTCWQKTSEKSSRTHLLEVRPKYRLSCTEVPSSMSSSLPALHLISNSHVVMNITTARSLLPPQLTRTKMVSDASRHIFSTISESILIIRKCVFQITLARAKSTRYTSLVCSAWPIDKSTSNKGPLCSYKSVRVPMAPRSLSTWNLPRPSKRHEDEPPTPPNRSRRAESKASKDMWVKEFEIDLFIPKLPPTNRRRRGFIQKQCGFIDFQNGENNSRKLFFHLSDFDSTNSEQLKVGDEVEFSISHNARSGKYSAIKIRRLTGSSSASLNSQISSSDF